MASAQSLLGLVNQLQTMESSFCDVLMEAALKLASLTGKQKSLVLSDLMRVMRPHGRDYAYLRMRSGVRNNKIQSYFVVLKLIDLNPNFPPF